jgi:S1-C subfamily serine protease
LFKPYHNEIYNKSYQIDEISISEFEDLVEAVVEKASPAVLGITNYTASGIAGVYSVCCTGSGAIYRGIAHMKNGDDLAVVDTINRDDVDHYEYYFVTNRHVVVDEDDNVTDKLEVYIGEDDQSIVAELIQYDPQVDLAVGKFNHTKYIQPLEFADSDQLKAGNFALAIGSPSGLDYYGSVTLASYLSRSATSLKPVKVALVTGMLSTFNTMWPSILETVEVHSLIWKLRLLGLIR